MDDNTKARLVMNALEAEANVLMRKRDFKAVAGIATFLNEAPVGSLVRLYDALTGGQK